MAHKAIAAAFALIGLVASLDRPLTGSILLATALVVLMDERRTFGNGHYRAILAFIASPWLILVGVVTSLLGLLPNDAPCQSEPCAGNFLLLPGFLLHGAGLTLLTWSLLLLIRSRRACKWPRG